MFDITICDVKAVFDGELGTACDDLLPLAADVVTICDRIAVETHRANSAKTINNNPELRYALEADASAISELIYAASRACCFTPEQPCPDWYQSSIEPAHIRQLLGSAQMAWLVAVSDKSLVGVLAIGDSSHVKYFFVHPAFQKLGVGRQLWQFALDGGLLRNTVTVRSSLFAVAVYARLGFKATEPPQVFKGMRYQTMEADLKNDIEQGQADKQAGRVGPLDIEGIQAEGRRRRSAKANG